LPPERRGGFLVLSGEGAGEFKGRASCKTRSHGLVRVIEDDAAPPVRTILPHTRSLEQVPEAGVPVAATYDE
jgi:hypothetical protein